MTMTYPSSSRKPLPLTYEEVVEALGIKILPAEENDNFLSNLIGLEEPKKYLRQTLNLYHNPDDPKNKKATLYRKFIFAGDSGSGRAVTAYTFAKEADLPIIVINCEKFVTEKPVTLVKGLKEVFDKYPKAVVLFKKFEYIGTLDDNKSIPVFSHIHDYINRYTDSFFFACTPSLVQFPEFVVSREGFNIILSFDAPTLAQREEFFNRFISEFPHSEDLKVAKIARDTVGMNAGTIYTLIHAAYNQALRDEKEEIDFESFDKVLSNSQYGYKKNVMTEKERKLTAYHEAGHVIAGYFSNPEYKLSKVEIVHRSESLGLTISENDEDKLSYTKSNYEADIMLCFGGMIAERMIFGENTSGVTADLHMATMEASLMVTKFGMNDEFGPVSLDEDFFFSSSLDEQVGLIVQSMLKDLYHKTEMLMLEHKDALIAVATALIEKETLYGEEVLEILKQFKKDI